MRVNQHNNVHSRWRDATLLKYSLWISLSCFCCSSVRVVEICLGSSFPGFSGMHNLSVWLRIHGCDVHVAKEWVSKCCCRWWLPLWYPDETNCIYVFCDTHIALEFSNEPTMFWPSALPNTIQLVRFAQNLRIVRWNSSPDTDNSSKIFYSIKISLNQTRKKSCQKVGFLE